jgi:hypothetical protein
VGSWVIIDVYSTGFLHCKYLGVGRNWLVVVSKYDLKRDDVLEFKIKAFSLKMNIYKHKSSSAPQDLRLPSPQLVGGLPVYVSIYLCMNMCADVVAFDQGCSSEPQIVDPCVYGICLLIQWSC